MDCPRQALGVQSEHLADYDQRVLTLAGRNECSAIRNISSDMLQQIGRTYSGAAKMNSPEFWPHLCDNVFDVTTDVDAGSLVSIAKNCKIIR